MQITILIILVSVGFLFSFSGAVMRNSGRGNERHNFLAAATSELNCEQKLANQEIPNLTSRVVLNNKEKLVDNWSHIIEAIFDPKQVTTLRFNCSASYPVELMIEDEHGRKMEVKNVNNSASEKRNDTIGFSQIVDFPLFGSHGKFLAKCAPNECKVMELTATLRVDYSSKSNHLDVFPINLTNTNHLNKIENQWWTLVWILPGVIMGSVVFVAGSCFFVRICYEEWSDGIHGGSDPVRDILNTGGDNVETRLVEMKEPYSRLRQEVRCNEESGGRLVIETDV